MLIETSQNHALPDVPSLLSMLSSIAVQNGNPGKGKRPNSSAGALATHGRGDMKAWPAPSADLLRELLNELPNDPGGPYDDRDDWQRVGHAVKGAAMQGGCEAEARGAFLEWSARNCGDPDHDAAFWDGCRQPRTGWGTLMRELQDKNPAGHDRIKLAVAQHDFAQHSLGNISALNAAPFGPVVPVNPADIPPRRFLYGKTVIAEYISMIVAPGGTGKSAFALVEAVAMATGRELLAGDKPHRPLRVWMHNGEDSDDEQARRLEAAMKFHGVTHVDLAGRLFMTSGRSMKICLARQGKDGPELVPGVVEGLIERITEHGMEVLMLDPLGAFHTLPENSNEAANVLMDGLRQIAHHTGVAVVLVHHTGKIAARDMGGAGAGAARGASAFVDAARNVRQLALTTTTDANKLGVAPGDAWRYVSVSNGKANLAPLAARTWIRLESVLLGNGTREYPEGDNVQTVSRWEVPSKADVSRSDLRRIQQAIAENPSRARSAATAESWVGYLIADVLELDIGSPGTKADDLLPNQSFDRTEVTRVLAEGVACGALIKVSEYDPGDRKQRPFIRVGTPVPDAPDAETEGGPE